MLDKASHFIFFLNLFYRLGIVSTSYKDVTFLSQFIIHLCSTELYFGSADEHWLEVNGHQNYNLKLD